MYVLYLLKVTFMLRQEVQRTAKKKGFDDHSFRGLLNKNGMDHFFPYPKESAYPLGMPQEPIALYMARTCKYSLSWL